MSIRLLRHKNEVKTIFDLLGFEENDMTSALGWTLANCREFLKLLVAEICGDIQYQPDQIVIRLQNARGPDGITDVEIDIGGDVVIIIEAKRGCVVPSAEQLEKYASSLFHGSVKDRYIVALTNASMASAKASLQCNFLEEGRLQHHSWRNMRRLAENAAVATNSSVAKLWLRAFYDYIGGILGMEYSNRVFVVSVGGRAAGWSITFRDIIEKKNRYIFPVGNRWPDPPPNYLGFRYDGRLQSIHHVKDYVTFTRPAELFPEAPADQQWPPHYCVTLGPAIRPSRDVPNGPRIRMSNRVYCLIDTLLTSKTISDALTETESRDRVNDMQAQVCLNCEV
jgi:hypothetical protein